MDFQDRKRRYLSVFEERNYPAMPYLRDHAARFLRTSDLVFSSAGPRHGLAMLDIASHWLHNAYLYADAGVDVIALDVQGGEISDPAVMRFAQQHGIALLPCKALNDPVELDALPDEFFDLVMLGETLEHLTFNPIKLWALVYRKLKAGGRIVVTTPNYFYFRGAFRADLGKLMRGQSAGISIHDLIHKHDYAPHWKEFSRKDLQRYFAYLSPDFSVARCVYANMYHGDSKGRLAGRLARGLFPALFHSTLYAEVVLTAKRAGIVASAHW